MKREPEWPKLVFLAAVMIAGAAIGTQVAYFGLRLRELPLNIILFGYTGAFIGLLFYLVVTRLFDTK
jgi:uncharacterized membrane protein YfcA